MLVDYLLEFLLKFNYWGHFFKWLWQEGEQYAKDNGLFFLETSAKTAQNVNELFYEIGNSSLFLIIVSITISFSI